MITTYTGKQEPSKVPDKLHSPLLNGGMSHPGLVKKLIINRYMGLGLSEQEAKALMKG